jgi:hypothetical protein
MCSETLLKQRIFLFLQKNSLRPNNKCLHWSPAFYVNWGSLYLQHQQINIRKCFQLLSNLISKLDKEQIRTILMHKRTMLN